MKHIIIKLLTLFLLGISLLGPNLFGTSLVSEVQARKCPVCDETDCYDYCQDPCTYESQCIDNKYLCVAESQANEEVWLVLSSRACGSSIVGGIEEPEGVGDYNYLNADQSLEIGILLFASRLLNILTIIAGLWVMGNLIMGGFEFVVNPSSSDTMTKVKDKITFSLIGIVIIVAAYAVAGAIGLIFFGDASFILKPDIIKYGALAT